MCRYLAVFIVLALTMPAHASSFEQWKTHFQQRLVSQGHAPQAVAAIFDQIEFDPRVIALDRKQPEGHMTLVEYVGKTLKPLRIAQGKRLLQKHKALLQQIEQRYGVPPAIIVALWGKETDYGGYVGNFKTLDALATLAYEGRRRDYFESELAAAIDLVQRYHWPVHRVRGSWAGAIGQCQFMPSHYLNSGVDGDGDGRVDLWNSMPDIFASMAQLLVEKGWQRGLPWGHRVDSKMAAPKYRSQRLYQPDGPEGPTYVITHNFDVLKGWNKSGYFATAIGRLADTISQP